MILLFLALPTLRRTQLFSLAMPNALNFSFSYPVFLVAILVCYPVSAAWC